MKLIIGNTLKRWELDMTKYVINTVEVVKRVYVADAYTEEEALKKQKNQAPEKVEIVGELTYSIEAINSYEYQKDWVEKASGREDWVDTIITGGKIRHRSEWVYAHKDGRAENPPHGAGVDPKQGPEVNEIR